MGKEIAGNIRLAKTEGGQGVGDSANNPRTETERGETERGETSSKPTQKAPRLVTIKDPAEKGEKNVPEPKPKKKAPAKSKKKNDFDTNQFLEENLSTLIQVAFNWTAGATGVSAWAIEQEDAQKIADPLSNIIERLGFNTVDEKYVDYISLVTALGMIIVPRAVIHSQIKKAQKLERSAKNGQQQPNKQAGTVTSINKRANENPPPTYTNDVKTFIESVSNTAY